MAGKIFKVRFKESSILSVNYGQTSQQFSESSSVRFFLLLFVFAFERNDRRHAQIYLKLHHESWANQIPVSDVDTLLERIENDSALRQRFRVAMGLSSPSPASSKEDEESHPFTAHDSDASVIYHSEASGGDHNTRPMPKTPQMLRVTKKNKTVSIDNSTRVYVVFSNVGENFDHRPTRCSNTGTPRKTAMTGLVMDPFRILTLPWRELGNMQKVLHP